jgi:hypothetical protein
MDESRNTISSIQPEPNCTYDLSHLIESGVTLLVICFVRVDHLNHMRLRLSGEFSCMYHVLAKRVQASAMPVRVDMHLEVAWVIALRFSVKSVESFPRTPHEGPLVSLVLPWQRTEDVLEVLCQRTR